MKERRKLYNIYQELKVVNKKRGVREDSQILVGRGGGRVEGTDEKI